MTDPRRSWWLCLFLLVAPAASNADMSAASRALATGDEGRAFQEYETLAALGNPTAEYYCGVMQLKGQGTTRDVISGAAWLLAARDSGIAKELFSGERVLSALTNEQMSAARELADRRMAEASAVVPVLPPELVKSDLNEHAQMEKGLDAAYMKAINRAGESIDVPGFAWTVVRIVIDEDGEPRDLWSIENAPTNDFGLGVLEASRLLHYRAALKDGQHVAASFLFVTKHELKDVSVTNPEMKPYFQPLLRNAAAGDKASRYALVRMAAAFPTLRSAVPADKALGWMRELASDPEQGAAMYFMPDTIAHSGLPKVSRQEELDWRVRSARAGFGAAQLDLALMLWGEHTAESLDHAGRWLEPAVSGGYAPAAKYFSALLLTPEYAKRDAAKALEIVQPLLRNAMYEHDADTWQIAAAAYGAVGRRDEAIKHQWRAMTFLKNARMRARYEANLASLQAGKLIETPLLAIPPAGYY